MYCIIIIIYAHSWYVWHWPRLKRNIFHAMLMPWQMRQGAWYAASSVHHSGALSTTGTWIRALQYANRTHCKKAKPEILIVVQFQSPTWHCRKSHLQWTINPCRLDRIPHKHIHSPQSSCECNLSRSCVQKVAKDLYIVSSGHLVRLTSRSCIYCAALYQTPATCKTQLVLIKPMTRSEQEKQEKKYHQNEGPVWCHRFFQHGSFMNWGSHWITKTSGPKAWGANMVLT